MILEHKGSIVIYERKDGAKKIPIRTIGRIST